jgi:16S rRNA (adenine(1408)-N(1))-methyltransferase
MLKQVIGKNIKELNAEQLNELMGTSLYIVVDLGTGDGKFAYNYAKNNPAAFVIGIDASAESMEEVSYKTSRKPAKGGLDNLVFIWASAEQLPEELTDVAHEIYINFPWGSLLSGVMKADPVILNNIRKLAREDATIHVFTSYDTKFEPDLLTNGGMPELSLEFIQETLTEEYADQGLVISDAVMLDEKEKRQLTSSWPKKILSKRARDVFYFQVHPLIPEDGV